MTENKGNVYVDFCVIFPPVKTQEHFNSHCPALHSSVAARNLCTRFVALI